MALRSFAALAALVATALAQSQSPFIPSGISPSCASFLASLNTNAGLAPCFDFLETTLSAFSPAASSTSSSVSSTLGTLCAAAPNQCPQSLIGAQLSAFYAACPAELTSSLNTVVQLNYDSLYAITPSLDAICSKDDSGNYCATKLPKSSSTSGPLFTTTPGTNTTYYIPDASTFRSDNILFMFLQPSMSPSELCTSCTKSVITSFISWESTVPYAPGISRSQLLSGQSALYNSTIAQCGSLLGGAVQAAGGLSQSIVSAASRVGGYDLSAVVSTILGTVALVAASL